MHQYALKFLTVVMVLCASVAQAQSPPNPDSVSRSSSFEYDAVTGVLTKTIIEPGNAQLRLETAYQYDVYGNQVNATISSPATGTAAIAARSGTMAYDAKGQFPTGSTNALNQTESRTFNADFGLVTKQTDANQLTVSVDYDSLGRKTLEKRADGTGTKWDYAYCNGVLNGTVACPAFAAYVIQSTPLNASGGVMGAWSKVYFNGLHREVKKETQGFDGASVVSVSTEYDSLGRMYRSTRPYYEGQAPQWTTTYYDAVNRVQETVSPDGSRVAINYNGLTTTVTNAMGQTQKTMRDALGRVAQLVDNAGFKLTSVYDGFGQLLRTVDQRGNVIELAYDARGNKIQMADPDLGIWKYEYNALGAVTMQTDAKMQVTSFGYDLLGRLVHREEADLISNWTYDTCAKAIGRLCSVSAQNGYKRVHAYDGYGRPVTTVTTIDEPYTSSIAYDGATGRVASQTYPNGLTVKYGYTPLGYLSEVRNGSSNALYWQANAMDAEGRLLQQTYGNNVVTQQVYQASTGLLKNSYAGVGNAVQNLSFVYNALGNVESRSDANQKLGEIFMYDGLNRLTDSIVNSGSAGLLTQTYAYNEIGNITMRSGVGNYSYGASNNKPHALAQVILATGGVVRYGYDANGNLILEERLDTANKVIAGKERKFRYTSYNMPLTMAAPGVSMTYVYGAEHQRSKLMANGSTTIYVHPDQSGGLEYEKETKANGVVEHRNFVTAAGQVIALVKQAGGATTVNYLHRDNLGSTTAVTDERGTVIERLAYEPFGKRRFAGGSTDTDNTIVGVNTNRGFTNHEELDAIGLVHMNGRVYDPALGRFMSADPTVPHPSDMQSYNRYSYARNNPLAYIDMTGFSDEQCGYDGPACSTSTRGNKASVAEAATKSSNPQVTNQANGSSATWLAESNPNYGKTFNQTVTQSVGPNGLPIVNIKGSYGDNSANSGGGQPSTSGTGSPSPGGAEVGGNIPSVMESAPRPDNCQLICINQTTLLAYPRTFATGDFIQDNLRTTYSRYAAGGWNAFISVGKAWFTASVFVMGTISGASPVVALSKNALLEALADAKPTSGHPNQLMTTLEDGTRVIYRKDFGGQAHPIGGPFQGQGSINHYNIEIQNASGRTIENIHAVPHQSGGFIFWGKDGVIKR